MNNQTFITVLLVGGLLGTVGFLGYELYHNIKTPPSKLIGSSLIGFVVGVVFVLFILGGAGLSSKSKNKLNPQPSSSVDK
mgnify:CR=1 FL=1